jgi:hypothetical protein
VPVSPRFSAAATSAGGRTSETPSSWILPRLPRLAATVNRRYCSPGAAGFPVSAGRTLS